MKKVIVFLIMIMLTESVFGASAFDIKWGNQRTYSKLPGNTLRAWAESMEGRVGGGLGTGSIFYVDSNVATGTDSSGSSWTNAVTTLDAAVALCSDNRGDVIKLAQGHAETFIAANSADLDVIGITVIGMGTGSDRPTFTYTTGTAGEIVIAAANITINNLLFQPGIANVVHAIEVEADADGSIIEFCEFLSGSTDAYEFVDAIQVAAAADDLIIRYNKATETTAGAVSWLDLSAGVVDNLSMYGNEIYGDYSTGAVDSTGRIQTAGYYGFNTITNLYSGNAGFYFNAAATGVMEFNRVFTDAEATAIDPGSMSCFENYVATAVDVSGMITPVYDDGTTMLNATTVTAIASAVDALNGIGMIGLCDTNVTATTVDSVALGGYGDSAFVEGWSLMCIFDSDGSVGTAPSGLVRDVTAYTSTGGVFTTATWGTALTAGDYVLLTPTHLIPKDGFTYGKTIYCDDGGSDGEGTSWQTAKVTLAKAIAIVAAGDTILVGENHTESLTTAGDTLSVAGVTILGMGKGDSRPVFIQDASSDELTLNAAGITLKNVRFQSSSTAQTSCVVLGANGDGVTIEDVSFIEGVATGVDEWVDVIVIPTTAVDATIKNCTYYNTQSSGHVNTFVDLTAATISNPSVIGCTVFGDFAEAPIYGGAAVPTNISIKDNTISNTQTGQLAIEFQNTATGVISGNVLYSNTFGSVLDPGSASCVENYATNAVNTSGYLVPVVSTKAGDSYATEWDETTYLSDDAWIVAGGPILITSLVGQITTAYDNALTRTWWCDATTAVQDVEFTDSVDINAYTVGDRIIFTNANPALHTDLAGAGANIGASSLMSPWFCPIGTIEVLVEGPVAANGDITWYMTYIPLVDGVTVTPQ